jgi:hypothetical protein
MQDAVSVPSLVSSVGWPHVQREDSYQGTPPHEVGPMQTKPVDSQRQAGLRAAASGAICHTLNLYRLNYAATHVTHLSAASHVPFS